VVKRHRNTFASVAPTASQSVSTQSDLEHNIPLKIAGVTKQGQAALKYPTTGDSPPK